jgi:hypothetical protein
VRSDVSISGARCCASELDWRVKPHSLPRNRTFKIVRHNANVSAIDAKSKTMVKASPNCPTKTVGKPPTKNAPTNAPTALDRRGAPHFGQLKCVSIPGTDPVSLQRGHMKRSK